MIEVRGLTKAFGDQRAVDDLSFTAPGGKVTGFLGPNGAGKTTTFRCLLGLAEPTSGATLIDGRRYRDLASPRRTVGAVLESSGFHPARTGRNHLRVIARAAGLDPSRIDPLLDVVGLGGAADRRVGGYSLGMRQRLSIATAMLGDPEVVVLDEPANGLDPEGVGWVRRILRFWADEGPIPCDRTLAGVFTQRVERCFDNSLVLRVECKLAQRIDDTVVVSSTQCRDGPSAQFQIGLTARDAENHRRNCFAAVAAEQGQRGALATYCLRRAGLEPFGRRHDAALHISLKQCLQHDNLEFTRIVVIG